MVHEEIAICIQVISIIYTSVYFGPQWLPQSFLGIFFQDSHIPCILGCILISLESVSGFYL